MDYNLYSITIQFLIFDLNKYHVIPYCHSLVFLSFLFFFFLMKSYSSRFSLNAWRGEMGHLFVYGTPLKLNVMNIFLFVLYHVD